MHTAFIDFKQEEALMTPSLGRNSGDTWSAHACRLLFCPLFMSNADEYILKDGEKTARVYPNTGVKQGCPLSHLLISLWKKRKGYASNGNTPSIE